MDQDKIKSSLESIFKKYNFSKEEVLDIIENIAKIAEVKTLESLSEVMSKEQKDDFDLLFKPEMTEADMKKIYEFIDQNSFTEKVMEIRNKSYDEVITNYIDHMNA